MRIGKWKVSLVRWGLRFEPRWGTRVGDLTSDGRHQWACAGPVSWVDMSKHYSAEDVKRWRDELGGHLGGV